MKKIDIFINGKYDSTTTQAKTCREAILKYKKIYKIEVFRKNAKITAHFAK